MTSKTQQAIEALDRLLEEFMTLDDDKFHWWYQEKIGEWQEKHRKALEQTQWQPIETAPKDGTTVLLFSNKNGLGWNITGYGRWEGGDDIVSGWVSFGMIEPGGNLGLANPTHWMPLPAAPRDGRD